MTYREIFLQADPHAITDAIGAQDVEIKWLKVLCNTLQAFDICKGLKFLAQGKLLNESAEVALEKTLQANTCLTTKQARFLVTGIKGFLGAALEGLGFNQSPKPDELVNEWLDQTVPDSSDDTNKLATEIISKLITNRLNKYE